MKKIYLFTILLLCVTSLSYGKTLAQFRNRQYFITDIQFSPDGKKLAFLARDGKKHFGPSRIYVGSAYSGGFKITASDPVSSYVWKNNSELLYSVNTRESRTIKSLQIQTGTTATLFSTRLKMTGSGYSRGYEKFVIHAIAPSGKIMIVERDRGAFEVLDLKTGRAVPLNDFSIPYSSNPLPRLVFSGDSSRALLFDARNRTYRLYSVSGTVLKLIQETGNIKGIQPGADFMINRDGTGIAFTKEVCKGGCYHVSYIYSFKEGRLYKNRTIRSGQILRVVFDENFKKAVANNMHRQLILFPLEKTGTGIR